MISRRLILRGAAAVAGAEWMGRAAESDAGGFVQARANAKRFDEVAASMQRLLQAWLRHADARTLLLPDRVPTPAQVGKADAPPRLYTPHNSGADLYPYLILTAHLTDPELYRGRMMEMLRNEVRFTTVGDSVPANLELDKRELGQPSLFGAGEYAKDGLVSVTEYLGRTPWFYRMVDMTVDAMKRAPVNSRFGKLPAADAELNGDFLQTLVRLQTMTGDQRFTVWARRIADAYLEEVLPGNHGVPSGKWDFDEHTGDGTLRLRDHGNETVVGLVLQYALENYWGTPRAVKWKPVIARMLDRILESANADGMLYNQVNAATLAPVGAGLSDNWGYVYGAVYTFYQCTGETKYRDAVRRVLGNLPRYRNHVWEPPANATRPVGSFDGYADAIESALYLVNREPVAEAMAWIESEMAVMMGMQKPDGHVEYWYGEGNYNRTSMIYLLMKSQGARPERWRKGTGVGAVRDGERLLVHVMADGMMRVTFDFARHRRVMNLDRNYVRLNEFPEWFVVDENRLYRVRPGVGGAAAERTVLGAELVEGILMMGGDWVVEPLAR